MLVKLDHVPEVGMNIQKYLKPLPRFFWGEGRQQTDFFLLKLIWRLVESLIWRLVKVCLICFSVFCLGSTVHIVFFRILKRLVFRVEVTNMMTTLYFGCRNRFFVLAAKGSQREGAGGAHASVSDGGRWMGRVTYPGQSFQRMEAAPVGSTKHSLT